MALTLSGSSPSLQSYQGGALTSGTAQASTSGTAITFTGIPSWVKRITVMLNGVSGSASSNFLIQLGAGSVTSTGYISTSISSINSSTYNYAVNSTAGFIIRQDTASESEIGSMVICNVSGNTWVATGVFVKNTSAINTSAGNVTLNGTLDRVVLTTVNGTDTFDSGSINILYE